MSSLALALPINYGGLSGTTVDYVDIEENSATDPDKFPPNIPGLGLFGAPTIAGDSLDFSPNNFYADSQFGAAPDLTDGHLTFGVNAKSGFAIDTISFQEGGGLSVVGAGVNDNTFVDVSAIGFINVLEVDGAPINVVQIPFSLSFNFGNLGNGMWRRNSEGFVNGFLWTGAGTIDITQFLIDNTNIDPVFGATKITVALDNSLYAQSELTSGAFIDKKDFGGLSITVNGPVIPEPATWLLGMLGCMVYGASRRNR